jgi:hypothetical protein
MRCFIGFETLLSMLSYVKIYIYSFIYIYSYIYIYIYIYPHHLNYNGTHLDRSHNAIIVLLIDNECSNYFVYVALREVMCLLLMNP